MRFSYSFNTETTENGIEQLYINNQGLIEEIQGEVNQYTNTQVSGIWHQYIDNYAFQAGILFKFIDLEKWSCSAGGGIDYSFAINTSGSYLSDEYTIEKFSAPSS